MNDTGTQHATDGNKAKRCVLLIEDEPAAREASALFLERVGFRVATASSARHAVKQAELHRPEIVVSDWRLGEGRDGVTVSRELQQRYGVPIVFVTAYPMDELREATADLNVIDYMAKPLSLTALATTLANFRE